MRRHLQELISIRIYVVAYSILFSELRSSLNVSTQILLCLINIWNSLLRTLALAVRNLGKLASTSQTLLLRCILYLYLPPLDPIVKNDRTLTE